MARTRMWVFESDQYGMTDRKFSIDDPICVPRIGEFVDSDDVGGWVDHVQYMYNTRYGAQDRNNIGLVINVSLKRTR